MAHKIRHAPKARFSKYSYGLLEAAQIRKQFAIADIASIKEDPLSVRPWRGQLIENGSDQTLKKDAGKIPVELLSEHALLEIAKVLQFGARKYAPDGWRKGMEWRRLIGAALRHLLAFSRGEDLDTETGLSHLAHLGCCAMFLLEYQLTGNGTDNRYKKPSNRSAKGPLPPSRGESPL